MEKREKMTDGENKVTFIYEDPCDKCCYDESNCNEIIVKKDENDSGMYANSLCESYGYFVKE